MKHSTRIVWAIVDASGGIHQVLTTRAWARRIVVSYHRRATVRKLLIADLGAA